MWEGVMCIEIMWPAVSDEEEREKEDQKTVFMDHCPPFNLLVEATVEQGATSEEIKLPRSSNPEGSLIFITYIPIPRADSGRTAIRILLGQRLTCQR